MLSNVGIGVEDPQQNISFWSIIASFPWNYSSTAVSTGLTEFQFSAFKQGFEPDYKKVSIQIEDLPSIKVQVKDSQNNPIENAKVLLDNELIGTTNSNGTKNIPDLLKGLHSIETQCANNKTCGTKTVVAVSGENETNFTCNCRGDLLVGAFTAQNNLPLANAYVFIDDINKGLTNPSGYLYIKNNPYGYRNITIGMKTKTDENSDYEIRSSSVLINFIENKQEIIFNVDVNEITVLQNSSEEQQQEIPTINKITSQDFSEIIVPVLILFGIVYLSIQEANFKENCVYPYKEHGKWPAQPCQEELLTLETEYTIEAATIGLPINKYLGKFAAYFGKGAVQTIEALPKGSKAIKYLGRITKLIDSKRNTYLLKLNRGIGFKIINIGEELIQTANSIKNPIIRQKIEETGNFIFKMGARNIGKEEFFLYSSKGGKDAVLGDLGEIFGRQLNNDLANQGVGRVVSQADTIDGHTLGTVIYRDTEGVIREVTISLKSNLRSVQFKSGFDNIGEIDDLFYFRDDLGTVWLDAKTKNSAYNIAEDIEKQALRNNQILESLTGKPSQGIITVPKGTLSEPFIWGNKGVTVTLKDLEQKYGVRFIEMENNYVELNEWSNQIFRLLEGGIYG